MNGGKMRVYFFDAVTGEEIEHELNGRPNTGTGSFVAAGGKRYMNVRTEVYVVMNKQERKVTAADFGGRGVLAKIWHPETKPEFFYLVPMPEGGKHLSEIGSWDGLEEARLGVPA